MKFEAKRFEVIDHRKDAPDLGRCLTLGSNVGEPFEVELMVQDDGNTIKLFVSDIKVYLKDTNDSEK